MCDYNQDIKTNNFSNSSTKDFLSIKNDYNKIIDLFEQEKWQELEKHLYDIQMRYFQEAVAYNSINTTMPNSVQENARNCLQFLEQLAKFKGLEIITKKL